MTEPEEGMESGILLYIVGMVMESANNKYKKLVKKCKCKMDIIMNVSVMETQSTCRGQHSAW